MTFSEILRPGSGPSRAGVPWHDHGVDEINDLETRAVLAARWRDFTPVLTATTTDPTLGSGSVTEGRYVHLVGLGLVIYRFYIQFGSSGANAGSGEYRISTPAPISSVANPNGLVALGQVVLFDWSVSGHKELGVCTRAAASALSMKVDDATVFHNNPFTWANDDRFGGSVMYEAA